MASTNVDEFRLFHQLLTASRPDYKPFYFILKPGGKEPLGERGPWKEASVTFEEACDWMKAGYNIAIAGTDHDPLVIIDIDKEGVVDDVKPTLCVRTRKRTGRHFFYFTNDTRCKINVPTAEHVGEMRALWQYVVATGSYVRTDLTKLEAQPPEDQLPSLGSYTIEKDIAVATITYDELPLVFRKTIAEQGAQPQTKREPKKWDREGPQSKLWSLSIEDVIGNHPDTNFASPFHGSEGGSNTSVSNGLLHCWRHSVSLTPLQALVVKAGILDCTTAGDGHAGSAIGPSVIDFKDKDFVLRIWDYAKKNQIIPANDVHPFGEDLPKKKKKKGEKEEQKPQTALRMVGTKIYRQIRDEAGKNVFAVFDQVTGEISLAELILETNEIPTQSLKGVTFPRRLAPYGSPLLLYQRLKARVTYASDQIGHKNAVFCLWLMYHGCIPPRKRHNLQVIPMGPAGTGKGRYVELAKFLGDRARVTTDPTLATSYRLNAMLNGGLDILDEMPEDAEHIEAYVRGRYDPFNVQQRILDPHSTTDIAGFEIAGPTLVTRRRAFHDDANTDRGVIIKCDKPKGKVPLELINHEPDLELQDQLALFWSEHYGDEKRLLPTEEELMYNGAIGGDTVDCRLKLAAIYLNKLAGVVGEEATKDLEGFVEEQEIMRKELKSTSPEGMAVRAVWDIINEHATGYSHTLETKGGDRIPVVDTLACDHRGEKLDVIYIKRITEGERDAKVKLRGISWQMISYRASLTREQPNALLQPYSVSRQMAGDASNRVKTIGFNTSELDSAFRTFIPDYRSDWTDALNNGHTTQERLDQIPPSTPPPDDMTPPTDRPPEAPGAPTPSIEMPSAPMTPPMANTLPSERIDAPAPDYVQLKIAEVQTKLCPDGTEVEVNILEWMIKAIIERLSEGDRPSSFMLRQEGRRMFPDSENTVIRIVDTGFAEVQTVGEMIYRIRKQKASVSG